MKPKTTNGVLEAIEIQPVDMQHHRAELRRALLASPYWQKPNPGLFSKGKETMLRRTFIAAGAALSIAVIALVFGMIFMPTSTNTAYAAEIAQKSYQAVNALPPEQQGEVGRKLQVSDPKELLEKAKNAKDLKALTYDQFASQHPVPPDEIANLRRLTFLQFTDADGSQFVLGIDPSTNLPSFVVVGWGNPGSSKPDKPMHRSVNSDSSKDDGSKRLSFQSLENGVQVEGTIAADGKATFSVNGKKYAAPPDTQFSLEEPPSVKIVGNDVYVNGIKLAPEN
ncbi:MAG: hypothetical protein HY868_08485 [Chloroflexi bacterium]|nr:hypothetical protein [Chloroflexota bacterium]